MTQENDRLRSPKRERSPSASTTASLITDPTSALLYEKNAQISALQDQVTQLTNKIAALTHTAPTHSNILSSNTHNASNKKQYKLNATSATVTESESKCGKRRQLLEPTRTNIGRNASISTANALRQLQNSNDNLPQIDETSPLAKRILAMFQDPASHTTYLRSTQFAHDILKLCHTIKNLLQNSPRCAFLSSPCYVFGDIHGNLEDLHFFSDNIWRLGMSLTAGNFVFLGDYVDRGRNCLECVAYLLLMKLLLPHKVTLLRGNHETRDVNGWEEHYGERSFIYQARARFGDELGFLVWEESNKVFDRMPLSCVIDQDIFCVHGGIPRSMSIQDVLMVPRVAGINPPYEHESEKAQQVASDCIWSDPASEEQEHSTVNADTGFGESLRGGGAICFGHKAVTDFLQRHNYSYIMRAHEAHADGVAVSKGARVFTVFSTSKDHNQGSKAMAGCILVDSEKLQIINRSPAYKNQYVHRRDSVSLANLTQYEIDVREKVGLVSSASADESEYEYEEEGGEEEHYDQWEDMEDDEDDDGDHLGIRRTSAVDASLVVASPPGSHGDSSNSLMMSIGGDGCVAGDRRMSGIMEEGSEDDSSSSSSDSEKDDTVVVEYSQSQRSASGNIFHSI